MTIQNIKDMPTTVGGNIHESVTQAAQLLNKVTEMLERGDSPETILEVIEYVKGRCDA